MPRVGGLVIVLGGILGVIALAIALLPNGGDRAPASSSTDSPATATTITMEASDGEVTWGRLRWPLAGLSISAVVLVSARQVMVAAAPKRVRRPAMERAPSTRPVVFEPASPGWIPDGSQVSIGD